jgi:CRP-like cAMP-binding protein
MTPVPYRPLTRFLQAHADIPPAECDRVARIFHPYNLTNGQFFIQAGDVPTTFGFLISGLCRLYYLDAAGTEWTKSFCLAGSVVAAYSALLRGEPSRLFIEALEPSTFLVAEYAAYQTVTSEHPCWQIVHRKLAEDLFIKKEQRESQLLLDDAPTRYQHFLAEYPGLEARVKQYHIASYLGITPVSLSRIRAQRLNL